MKSIVVGKLVSFRLKPKQLKVWEDFKGYVLKKHGKLHEVLGVEVTNALMLYMETVKSGLSVEELFKRKEVEKPRARRIIDELPIYEKELLEELLPDTVYRRETIERLVMSISEVVDKRYISQRIKMLVAHHILKEVKDYSGVAYKYIGWRRHLIQLPDIYQRLIEALEALLAIGRSWLKKEEVEKVLEKYVSPKEVQNALATFQSANILQPKEGERYYFDIDRAKQAIVDTILYFLEKKEEEKGEASS